MASIWSSVRAGSWWYRRSRRAPAAHGELHGVAARGMAEVGAGRQLRVRVLGVMEQQVDAGRQGERVLVHLAEARRTGAQARRPVIGQVGDRHVAVADPVAEGAPALVGDLAGHHGEALDLLHPGFDGAEPPGAPQLARRDRKMRGRHRPTEHFLGVSLGRQVEIDARAHRVPRHEERDALGVVPMEVAEEDRALEGPSGADQGGDRPNARAGVEHEPGRSVVARDRDARRVPAVAQELKPGRRRRAPDAAHRHPHGFDRSVSFMAVMVPSPTAPSADGRAERSPNRDRNTARAA